jgi:hypothetical protein
MRKINQASIAANEAVYLFTPSPGRLDATIGIKYNTPCRFLIKYCFTAIINNITPVEPRRFITQWKTQNRVSTLILGDHSMSVRIITLSILALFLANLLVITPSGAAPHFAGSWVDSENTSIKMSIREDGGIFRITGGDEAYGYSLSCLVKDMKAVCTGSGGRLEGENFLYQSVFEFTNEGTMNESWKAFNNLQTIRGKTIWKHQ